MRQWQLKKEKHWNSSWISGLKETQSLWEHLYCSHFCSLHQTSVGFRLFKETCVWHGWDKSAINPRSIGWAAHPGHQGTAAPSPGRAEQAAIPAGDSQHLPLHWYFHSSWACGLCGFIWHLLFLILVSVPAYKSCRGQSEGVGNSCSGVELQLRLKSQPAQQLEFKSKSNFFFFFFWSIVCLSCFRMKKNNHSYWILAFTEIQFFPAKQIKEHSPNPLEYIFPSYAALLCYHYPPCLSPFA